MSIISITRDAGFYFISFQAAQQAVDYAEDLYKYFRIHRIDDPHKRKVVKNQTIRLSLDEYKQVQPKIGDQKPIYHTSPSHSQKVKTIEPQEQLGLKKESPSQHKATDLNLFRPSTPTHKGEFPALPTGSITVTHEAKTYAKPFIMMRYETGTSKLNQLYFFAKKGYKPKAPAYGISPSGYFSTRLKSKTDDQHPGTEMLVNEREYHLHLEQITEEGRGEPIPDHFCHDLIDRSKLAAIDPKDHALQSRYQASLIQKWINLTLRINNCDFEFRKQTTRDATYTSHILFTMTEADRLMRCLFAYKSKYKVNDHLLQSIQTCYQSIRAIYPIFEKDANQHHVIKNGEEQKPILQQMDSTSDQLCRQLRLQLLKSIMPLLEEDALSKERFLQMFMHDYKEITGWEKLETDHDDQRAHRPSSRK